MAEAEEFTMAAEEGLITEAEATFFSALSVAGETFGGQRCTASESRDTD
jgi:hypothetical protein